MTNRNSIIFIGIVTAGLTGGYLLGLIVGLNVGRIDGHKEACASVKAEWRDGKCVRIIVEDVK